jgi:hypothetical protein
MSIYISFITTIKICEKYEWLENSLILYIKTIDYYCKKYDICYEILICEQINEKNIFLISKKYNFNEFNVKIYNLIQYYDNPFDFNLIESYGKNECLKNASGIYTCMTSCDVLLSEMFFNYIKNCLNKEIFYRFATYEIPRYDYDINTNIEDIINYCEKCENKRLVNPGCFEEIITVIKLAQKSGDIMLLDTISFKKIEGWPENICFVHMDLATCIVATNNYPFMIPEKNICSFTFTQEYRNSSTNGKYIQLNDNKQITLEDYQLMIALSYMDKKKSN